MVGYVVMPEHIHLLVSEPGVRSPSTVMQVLKQRSASALLPKPVKRDLRQTNLFENSSERQARFYDFTIWMAKKHIEKLNYTHQNPVKRGLVIAAKDWR